MLTHSPDADDILCIMQLNLVGNSKRCKFENIALDIETLNQATLKGVYDILLFLLLYILLLKMICTFKTAVSFGEGYGPKLIKKKGTV